MDLNWLEDFLALAAHRNFSRAAEARNITQPAFSRRIQALEGWIGTPLVVRAAQGVTLNVAGEFIRDHSVALLRDIQAMRNGALEAAGFEGAALSIASTHALSLTFFPSLVRPLFPMERLGTLNLISDTMAACEQILVAGEADFLLCHARPDVPNRLHKNAFTSIIVGTDLLVPVCAPDEHGAARWSLPGRPERHARVLAYTAASGLGRIVEAMQSRQSGQLNQETAFTSPLAAALHTMARQGLGIAWLPKSMVEEDMATRRLVPAGEDELSIAIEVRLFRPVRHQSELAEAFWTAVATRHQNPAQQQAGGIAS